MGWTARDKRFVSPLQRPDRLWGRPSLQFHGYRGANSPDQQRPGRVADHSSSAEVKSEGAIPPAPHMPAFIKHRDNFALLYFFTILLLIAIFLKLIHPSLPLSVCQWLYSPRGSWPLFQFLNLYTVGRTPWTGDQPVSRPLPTHRATQSQ
jgi:hypothetical protein